LTLAATTTFLSPSLLMTPNGISGQVEAHSDVLGRNAIWTKKQRMSQLPQVIDKARLSSCLNVQLLTCASVQVSKCRVKIPAHRRTNHLTPSTPFSHPPMCDPCSTSVCTTCDSSGRRLPILATTPE
jgi:hypothetical protein